MRGRKPALKSTGGSGRPAKCPPAPTWLTTHAKAEWKRAAPDLVRRQLLCPETQASLETYCVAAGTIRELEDEMRVDGRIVRDADGKVIGPHPAFRMQVAAMREARLLASELGLTPHRRAVPVEPPRKGKEAGPNGWDADLLA